MTARANIADDRLGTDHSVGKRGPGDQSVSRFFAQLAADIRDRFRDKKIPKELAEFLDCEERSASRYLAGHRFFNGPQMVRMFEDDVLAPRMVTALLERLPSDRRAGMAAALIDAAELVRLRAEQDDIARRIAAKEGRR